MTGDDSGSAKKGTASSKAPLNSAQTNTPAEFSPEISDEAKRRHVSCQLRESISGGGTEEGRKHDEPWPKKSS